METLTQHKYRQTVFVEITLIAIVNVDLLSRLVFILKLLATLTQHQEHFTQPQEKHISFVVVKTLPSFHCVTTR
jgi:hypothetical protein